MLSFDIVWNLDYFDTFPISEMSQSTSDGPSSRLQEKTCKQGGRCGLEKPEKMPDI